jgi:hypothetical protein
MNQVKCRKRPILVFLHLRKKNNTQEVDGINSIIVVLFSERPRVWNSFASGNIYISFFTFPLFVWIEEVKLEVWPTLLIEWVDNNSSFNDKFACFSEKKSKW